MKPTQFEGFLFSSFLFLVECFHTSFPRFIGTCQNVVFLLLALALNLLYSRCVVETVFLLIVSAQCSVFCLDT
jgi:hypothetical protein